MVGEMVGFDPNVEVAQARSQLDHQVIDGDGHLAEFLPWVNDLVTEIGGPDVAARLKLLSFASFEAGSGALPVRTFYTVPARNTLDRMTTMLPELHYRRLAEFGIDYALLYPSYGLLAMGATDRELRQVTARALNTYASRAYEGLRDRLEPVAVIPCFTPDEAIEELDHAVNELGLKAVVMTGVIPRAVRPDGVITPWTDTLGLDSSYDYDPMWAKCVELGVTPAFHGIGYGWGSRVSATNYVYNHLGSFAAAQEAVCRSLVMGGVSMRFPSLHFSFLEGGVSWARQLFADLLSHFEKRNSCTVEQFDPKQFDVTKALALLDEHGRPEMTSRREQFLRDSQSFMARNEVDTDDFARSNFTCTADIVDVFTQRFSFGCEADDALIRVAFDSDPTHASTRMRAVFASDIGHWDVPDACRVFLEAYELREHEIIDADAFRRFTCDNVVESMLATNPRFFDGTAAAPTALRLSGSIASTGAASDKR
jgi:predicted TIM-barrel fold metal-dependent hydrolase